MGLPSRIERTEPVCANVSLSIQSWKEGIFLHESRAFSRVLEDKVKLKKARDHHQAPTSMLFLYRPSSSIYPDNHPPAACHSELPRNMLG